MTSSFSGTFTRRVSPSRLGVGTKIKGAVASLCAALVLLCASSSEAYDTCAASAEKSPCKAASGGGDDYCCAPGWVFDNNWANSGGIAVTWGPNSMQYTAKYNLNNSCCEALYAGIGNIGSTVVTDQYNKPGSHLPLQLKNISVLKGAWTIQVPPVKSTDIYRVYYELMLSSTTAGTRDKGNITIDFYHPQYGYSYGGKISTASLLGYSNMEVVDYGANPNGQGPFLAFALPANAYTPDKNGVITVSSVDVEAVLSWALKTYPKYYSNTVYLTELNLAQEAMTVNGTFTTTFASFEIQAAGSGVAYTPTWTDTYWTSGTISSGSPVSSGSDGGVDSKADGGGSSGATSTSGGGSSGASTSSGGSSGADSTSSGGSSGADSTSSGGSPGVDSTSSGGSPADNGGGVFGGTPDADVSSGAQDNGSGQGQSCSTGRAGHGKGAASLLVLAFGLALRRVRRRSTVTSSAIRQRS